RARRADHLGAALDLARLLGDGHDAEFRTDEARPGLRAVARDDALLLEDLDVRAARALDRGRRRAGFRLELQDEIERLLERLREELVDARRLELPARERDRGQRGAALGARLRRRARGGPRGIDRRRDGRRLRLVRAREAEGPVLEDADADAGVLGDLRGLDAALLDGDRARALLVVAELDEPARFRGEDAGEEVGRIGGGRHRGE